MEKNPKYEKIIESAVDIFAQKGFHETTMKEIAESAGIGKGTIYIHFENKDHLFSEILDNGIENLAQYVENEINKNNSPGNKLKKAIKAQLEYFSKHEDFCLFLFRELWGYRQDLKNKIIKLHNKHTVIIKEIIAEGIENGHFKVEDENTVSASIVGMIYGAAVHWFMFSKTFPLEKIYSDIVNTFFEKHIG